MKARSRETSPVAPKGGVSVVQAGPPASPPKSPASSPKPPCFPLLLPVLMGPNGPRPRSPEGARTDAAGSPGSARKTLERRALLLTLLWFRF